MQFERGHYGHYMSAKSPGDETRTGFANLCAAEPG